MSSLKDKYQVTNVFVSAVTPENISRQQLLAWVNDTLQANLTKIEEMSTGAAYCLLTDRLFPGSIPLQKVKWNTKSDVDSIANWKLVQNAWHALGITKPIQVQTLLKGKFQDNFEFLQWFKRFYDHNDMNYEYDPLAARNNEPFPSSVGMRTSKLPARNTAPVTNRRITMAPGAIPSKPSAAPAPRKSMAPAPRPATTANNNTARPVIPAQIEAKYRAEISELKDQISTWEKTLSSVERERDYYYERLHKLELLCNDLQPEQNVQVSKILAILYQDDSNDLNDLEAFEAVEEKILHEQEEQHPPTNGVHQEPNTTVDHIVGPNTTVDVTVESNATFEIVKDEQESVASHAPQEADKTVDIVKDEQESVNGAPEEVNKTYDLSK